MAYVGCTGSNVTKDGKIPPHLHLELYINGKFTTGDLVKHGGSGQAVDPTISYGGIDVPSYRGSGDGDDNHDKPVDPSEGKKVDTKPKANKGNNGNNKINACIIGDSWAVDMHGYFRYSYVKSGAAPNDILHFIKKCTKHKGFNKMVLFYLGGPYYMGYPDVKLISNAFPFMLARLMYEANKTGKKLYICTTPNDLHGGASNSINNKTLTVINRSINEHTDLGYTVIHIPDPVTADNLKNGYLLKDYTKVVEIIKNNL